MKPCYISRLCEEDSIAESNHSNHLPRYAFPSHMRSHLERGSSVGVADELDHGTTKGKNESWSERRGLEQLPNILSLLLLSLTSTTEPKYNLSRFRMIDR